MTALAPSTVSTTTGGRVTITGSGLDRATAVRVGDTGGGRILSASSTGLSVEVPARIAGTYTVTVFEGSSGTAETTSVLPEALTYVAPSGGAPAPTATTTPTPPAAGTPTSAPSSTPTSVPSTTAGPRPSQTAGPGGLRLVRRDDLGAATTVWSLGACETGCSGVFV